MILFLKIGITILDNDKTNIFLKKKIRPKFGRKIVFFLEYLEFGHFLLSLSHLLFHGLGLSRLIIETLNKLGSLLQGQTHSWDQVGDQSQGQDHLDQSRDILSVLDGQERDRIRGRGIMEQGQGLQGVDHKVPTDVESILDVKRLFLGQASGKERVQEGGRRRER